MYYCHHWRSTDTSDLPTNVHDVEDVLNHYACNTFSQTTRTFVDRDGDNYGRDEEYEDWTCTTHDRRAEYFDTDQEFWERVRNDIDAYTEIWVCIDGEHDDEIQYSPVFPDNDALSQHIDENHELHTEENHDLPEPGTRVRILRPQWNNQIWGWFATVTGPDDEGHNHIYAELDHPNPASSTHSTNVRLSHNDYSLQLDPEALPDWLIARATEIYHTNTIRADIHGFLWRDGTEHNGLRDCMFLRETDMEHQTTVLRTWGQAYQITPLNAIPGLGPGISTHTAWPTAS